MDQKIYAQKHYTDHCIFLQLYSFSVFVIIRIAVLIPPCPVQQSLKSECVYQ
jgi:hypothetical protein